MDDTYIFSMREHLDDFKSELHGLNEILNQRLFTRYEYRAAERSLQVLIEACIGIAKNLNYVLYNTAPADAYSAFEKLSQQGMEGIDNVAWRKIIGMRNALIHDYLNIDSEIIKAVIKTKAYDEMFSFAEKSLSTLQTL